MNALVLWRKCLFTGGWILQILGAILLLIAGFRSPHLRAIRSYNELGIWMGGGLLIAFLSLVLLLFGAGKKRSILVIVALIELYLWFSYVALMVQLT